MLLIALFLACEDKVKTQPMEDFNDYYDCDNGYGCIIFKRLNQDSILNDVLVVLKNNNIILDEFEQREIRGWITSWVFGLEGSSIADYRYEDFYTVNYNFRFQDSMNNVEDSYSFNCQ